MITFSRRAGLALAISAGLSLTPLAAMAETHEVRIEGFEFVPVDLTVAAGDTIVFVNKDGAPHTATADDKSFDTGRLGRNEAGEITLSEAGTFTYFCKFHRNMKGSITVN